MQLATPTPTEPVEVLWDIDQLAAYLHKSRATIYSDLSRRPHVLPPRVAIPGSSRILFRDPPAWAAQFVVEPSAQPAASHEPRPQPRRRGAPTKSERLRRQAEGAK